VSIERFSVLELDQLRKERRKSPQQVVDLSETLRKVNKGTHHGLVLCGIEK
jgi:hypothetical protein